MYLFSFPHDEESVLVNFASRAFVRALAYLPERKDNAYTLSYVMLTILKKFKEISDEQEMELTDNVEALYHTASVGFAYGYTLGSKNRDISYADKHALLDLNKDVVNHYLHEFSGNWEEMHDDYTDALQQKDFMLFIHEIEKSCLLLADKNKIFLTKEESFFQISEARRLYALLTEWIV
jgi:hypothetical protein